MVWWSANSFIDYSTTPRMVGLVLFLLQCLRSKVRPASVRRRLKHSWMMAVFSGGHVAVFVFVVATSPLCVAVFDAY